MGMAAILVMWPGPFEHTFVPLSHGDSIWNLASISPVVSEEKMFKECERQMDRQQTTDGWQRPTYPISSPMSLWLRWAKKRLSPSKTQSNGTHLTWWFWHNVRKCYLKQEPVYNKTEKEAEATQNRCQYIEATFNRSMNSRTTISRTASVQILITLIIQQLHMHHWILAHSNMDIDQNVYVVVFLLKIKYVT